MSIHHITLSDVSSENARRYPDTVAVIDDEVRLTWTQFERRVNQVANVLTDHGVGTMIKSK